MKIHIGVIATVSLVISACGSGSTNASHPAPVSAAITKQAEDGLGTMSFTLNVGKASTVKVDPAQAASVAATDTAGYAWSLAIPAGALAAATSVTITPFATVSSPGATDLVGGVSFAPDGLMFEKPATLTVTPPKTAPATVQVYTAQSDGSQLQYADMTTATTAQISHFSSAGASPHRPTAAQAQQDYNVALEAVKALLASPNTALPEPPDYTLHCIASSSININDPEIRSYIHGAEAPERLYAEWLIGTARLALFYVEADTAQLQQDLVALYTRIGMRVAAAVTLYRGNMNAFPALASLSLHVVQIIMLAGGSLDPLLNIIGNWAAQLATKSLTQVTGQHEYDDYPEIAYLYTAATLLGADTSSMGQQIASAFRFTLTLTEDGKGLAALPQQAHAAGDIVLPLVAAQGKSLQWFGTATIPYTEQVLNAQMTSPTSLDIAVSMNLDNVCSANPTANITQNIFGQYEVTHQFPSGLSVQSLGFLDGAMGWAVHFSKYLVGTANPEDPKDVTLALPLQNKNATAVNETLTYTAEVGGYAAKATLQYVVKHTPGS